MGKSSGESQNYALQLKPEEKLTIGQLTNAVEELTEYHCTPAMIYNYEKKGLIQPLERTKGGFRLFTPLDIKRVACIKEWQSEGLSLNEIGKRMEDCEQDLKEFDQFRGALESQRTKILRAAKEVFPRKGYAETNLSDIAQQAGVSSSALYRYFDSKRDLFMALIDNFSFRDVMEQIIEGLKNSQIGTREDVRKALILVGQAFLNAHTQNKEFHRMFLAESGNYPEIGKLYTSRMIAPLVEMFEQFIQHQIEVGLFREVEIKIAVFSFFGNFLIVHSSQNLLHGKEVVPLPEEGVVEKMVDLYLTGMWAGES